MALYVLALQQQVTQKICQIGVLFLVGHPRELRTESASCCSPGLLRPYCFPQVRSGVANACEKIVDELPIVCACFSMI